ncbi:hypothetical protein LTSEMON_4420 [Salmonella enterica subsp. enterica serovar Montevideo str. S5-403]|uniref:Uncharacterized protein n=1 Tax=Salmonella enterica subsp. enterica serovar Montevideo str. S5-403 TaxID=913242 RepID=G5Q7V4_SALMO|nr:hypothetical protein LTSEMON_4420 [Salmonella enterica subsp. enterica serovar Montevideo str. S5-403]
MIHRRSIKLKKTEIPFILFSSGFPRNCQYWRCLAVWFVEKEN